MIVPRFINEDVSLFKKILFVTFITVSLENIPSFYKFSSEKNISADCFLAKFRVSLVHNITIHCSKFITHSRYVDES